MKRLGIAVLLAVVAAGVIVTAGAARGIRPPAHRPRPRAANRSVSD